MLFLFRNRNAIHSKRKLPCQLGLYNTSTAPLCPGYGTKQSDGEVPVMLELWEMRSSPLLPSLPDLLWIGLVAPDRVLSMGQIELNCVPILNWIARNRTVLTCKLRTYTKLNCLKWNCFWHWNCTYVKLIG